MADSKSFTDKAIDEISGRVSENNTQIEQLQSIAEFRANKLQRLAKVNELLTKDNAALQEQSVELMQALCYQQQKASDELRKKDADDSKTYVSSFMQAAHEARGFLRELPGHLELSVRNLDHLVYEHEVHDLQIVEVKGEAKAKGVEPHDYITHVDCQPVSSATAFAELIHAKIPGQYVKLRCQHYGTKDTYDVKLTIAGRSEFTNADFARLVRISVGQVQADDLQFMEKVRESKKKLPF